MGLLSFFKRTKSAPAKRDYLAASKGRLYMDFKGSNKSADAEIRWSLRDLRNRSRDLERNNEYARRYLQLLQTNIVGESGFRLQLKGRNIDGTIDMAGNNIIEAAWEDFCRLGGPTVDGKMSMTDLSNHVIRGMARDGEVFLHIINKNYLRHGIGVQIIEPDRVDDQMNETLRDGNQVRMGIELDSSTRRVAAYHVLVNNPGDYDYATTTTGTFRQRIPADRILHVYVQERADQTRGVPWTVTAMPALKMLHGYREAELVAARVGAAKMGFFTSPAGDGFTADGFEDTFTPLYDAEAGTFHQLPAGVDFKAFDPTHPTTAFADFEKAILRGIAGGLGVSYTAIANDLEGTSYSSIRQGALEERDFYKTQQRFMIEHFIDPMFRLWMRHVMDFALIPINGQGKFEKFALGISWRARGFQWVDPLKEINAAVVGLQNGIISHTDIAATYGRDAEETFAQIQRDKEMAKIFGLTMAYEPFGNKAPVPATVDGENAV
jgi:lambda family phage portal protein